MSKNCYRCGRDLPLDAFGKNKSKPDGLATECKECKSKQGKEYHRRYKDEIKVRKHDYYLKNREATIKRTCQYAKDNPVKHRSWTKKSRDDLKLKVVSVYSKTTCQCANCCEDNIGILTIDHIGGNGAEHRRELFGNNRRCGYPFYVWLKKNNYPSGFQALCYNCNFRKRAIEMKPENPTHLQQVRARYARRIKLECLDNYGGRVCSCGEKDIEVLTLDHVNDDGAEHRRKTNTRGFGFYMMLRKNDFPRHPPLQVMCMNCQIKKREVRYPEACPRRP